MQPFLDVSDKPPETLYKFLGPGLVTNVLEQRTAKFTQMANTNDIFEVRKTFERLAGPRFDAVYASMRSNFTTPEAINKSFDKKMKERFEHLPRHLRRKARKVAKQEGLLKTFKSDFEKEADSFVERINSDEGSQMYLDMYGKDMLCFSLTESYDNPVMWASYADNQKGFVLGFKSDHDWFKNQKDRSKSRLHKVTYFDGILDEFLEDPEAAFCSKTTHWSYEREWRIYCGMKDIEKTVANTADPIHLISFPPDLIQSIIVGAKASNETVDAIKNAVKMQYPDVTLFIAKPNNRTAAIELALM